MSRVSKVVRWIGIIGGVGAAVWAARDRFISLTLPTEPEPPQFRSTPAPDEVSPDEVDDLTEIAGIGPVFAERLASQSVSSWKALAARTPSEVAEITGASESRAAGWIAEAAHRVGG